MGYLPEREVCHMRRHIDFDKIGITDDVMFCTVLSNSEDCREFLQRILGIEIEEIVVVGTQVSMKSNFHAKGVRLDVYAKDKKGNAYDIEMQTTKMRELPLRSRYYHSEMDSYQIAAGEKYGNLKHSIVIFVCNFDLFAKNRSVYTFESICREDIEIHLQDKRKTIFININGSREDVPEELAHLLDYLKTKTPTDGFTERLEQRVLKIRKDTEWRDDYMTLEMKMDEKYEQGREQGLKEGITKGIEQGIEQGIELGIGQGLRVQIQKKLNKGKSISQIADECEESEEVIWKIIRENGWNV